MTRPWKTLDSVETAEGTLELRRRGALEWGILDPGSCNFSTRESAAARIGCRAEWDAILARPGEVGELARSWRERVG